MAKIQQQIEKIENELANLKVLAEEDRLKSFEFKYAPVNYVVEYNHTGKITSVFPNRIKHGRYRKTKEVAEQALALNMRVNRLHALVDQLDGFGGNYCSATSFYPEIVLMTSECAEEICRMLNNNKFSLEV